MKILYITYINMDKALSGSAVRPIKLLDEFIISDYQVELLSGSFTKKEHKERKEKVEKLIERIKKGEKFDFCYIESISGLLYKFYNKYEYNLWDAIKKAEIPIGIFYRDIYWKFAKEFNYTSFKYRILNFLCCIELKKICKIMDVVFVPSIEMSKYMPKANYIPLPPGCDNIKVIDSKNDIPSFIYVGGVSYNYGTDLMLNAFKLVNQSLKVNLNLVCRLSEINIVNDFIKNENYTWLKVFHASGKELEQIYAMSDYAIISLRKKTYHNFCMPVKFFEYMSFEKPVLSTNCNAVAQIINNNNLGLIVEDNPEDFAEGIKNFLKQDINFYKNNIKNFKDKNKWGNRVRTITENLLK